MATTKSKAKKKPAAPKKTVEKIDKNLLAGLQNIQELAIAQISSAKDPFKTGLAIIAEIRKVAIHIENEIEADSRYVTEAYDSGPGMVGVGLGVL